MNTRVANWRKLLQTESDIRGVIDKFRDWAVS